MAKLKIYDNHANGHGGYLPRPVLDALGVPGHVQQATIFVVAATKKAAAARLDQVGINSRFNPLRVGMGDDLDTLRDLGLLADEGTVLVKGERPRNVVRVVADGLCEEVGAFTYDRSTHQVMFRPAVPSCPHGCGPLAWAEDAWICPECDDEWPADLPL